MSAYPNQLLTAYDFQLETVELSPSKRPDLVVDIRRFVIEINIYEHLEKPYLSGNIVVSDTAGVYPHLDIKGIDRVKIGVKLPDNDAAKIERTFYVDEVINSTRTNDNEIVYVLHIVEDIAYLSNFIMVTAAFDGDNPAGSGTQILENLFRNYFGREINRQGDIGELDDPRLERRHPEITPPLRYIAPSIAPLAVAEAIKRRMYDVENSPYFLYSSLAGENIHLQSFMDMLVYNKKYANRFVFSQANTSGPNSGRESNRSNLATQQFNIESYTDNSTVNFKKINDDGYVNSMFYFYDVTRGVPYNPTFGDPTVTNRAIVNSHEGTHWTAFGMFTNPPNADTSLKYLYPKNAMLPWDVPTGRENAEFNQGDVLDTINNPAGGNATLEAVHRRPPAKNIINVFGAAGFDDFSSYNETPEGQSQYLELVNANAIRKWVVSDPIQFVVPGRVFLSRPLNDRPRQTAIGRVAELSFTAIEGTSVVPDLKRSGDHLLYAARHMFSAAEGYKVHFTGIKIDPVEETGRASEQGLPPSYGPSEDGTYTV